LSKIIVACTGYWTLYFLQNNFLLMEVGDMDSVTLPGIGHEAAGVVRRLGEVSLRLRGIVEQLGGGFGETTGKAGGSAPSRAGLLGSMADNTDVAHSLLGDIDSLLYRLEQITIPQEAVSIAPGIVMAAGGSLGAVQGARLS
jgi:hypothetical protein